MVIRIKKIYKLPFTIYHLRAKRPGLSLIELQIVVAILGGIALVTGAVYYTYTRLINEERITIEIASQNRNAIDEMTNQIREAQSVAMGCTICGSVTDSTSQVLILSLWPIDAGGDLFAPTGNEYDYMVYRLDSAPNDTNLLKEIIGNGTGSSRINTSKILASNVDSLEFAYDNADPAQATEVAVTLTNQKTSFVKTHTLSQSSKALLRNK
ncbi:hypothetical protein A3D04_04070 [Candidatus Curtissbacteria bacterium RIFCSPHIGHO2_02_FULL_40_16b]|uniref:Prepilin-type N-terminal cleavage/methylation domain-containing protein n=1 Tax=Candidatus Curtissbacteria bacterium RIFCSPHIGHO2_02_FULL_40_16b TaxID=1797714 RepID=A0A1F5G6J7_9BACT|nr:MAG: hypothetical protein A3D04_04070 [Candidatus Curtissbacteria bacterium RIFCSPHIGHO2_02_FULL_40_16b]